MSLGALQYHAQRLTGCLYMVPGYSDVQYAPSYYCLPRGPAACNSPGSCETEARTSNSKVSWELARIAPEFSQRRGAHFVRTLQEEADGGGLQ